MGFVQLLCLRIGRFFHAIAAAFSRVLCLFKKRQNIGELPYTVKVVRNQAPDDPYPSPMGVASEQTAGWDNQWGEKAVVEDKIEEWRKKTTAPHDEGEKEPDFFNDMQPEIKKTKKVLLKTRAQRQSSEEKRNLFQFQGDVIEAPVTAELGELEDNAEVAWDDDIDSTLHEHRLEKHRARHDEHERRNMEKRGMRAGGGHY